MKCRAAKAPPVHSRKIVVESGKKMNYSRSSDTLDTIDRSGGTLGRNHGNMNRNTSNGERSTLERGIKVVVREETPMEQERRESSLMARERRDESPMVRQPSSSPEQLDSGFTTSSRRSSFASGESGSDGRRGSVSSDELEVMKVRMWMGVNGRKELTLPCRWQSSRTRAPTKLKGDASYLSFLLKN